MSNGVPREVFMQSFGDFIWTCLTSLLTLGALFLLAGLIGNR